MKGVFEGVDIKLREFFLKLSIVEKVLSEREVEIEMFKKEVKVFVVFL